MKRSVTARADRPGPGACGLRLRFLGIYGSLLLLYFLVSTPIHPGAGTAEPAPLTGGLIAANRWMNEEVLIPYQVLIASASGRVLRLLGLDVTVDGPIIRSERFAIVVTQGCDAVEVSLLLLAAVLAFPSGWGRKVPAIVGGFGLLAVTNLVRVVTLWLTGVVWRDAFEWVHLLLWPFVLILTAGAAFGFWVNGVTRGPPFGEKQLSGQAGA